MSGEFTFAVKATDAEQYAGEYTLNGTRDYEGLVNTSTELYFGTS